MSSVSVIIPTWNRAAFLRQAIESAAAQSVRPLEILVCDDGSTDESEQVVRDLANAIVKWIPGPRNGHSGVTRNRGLEQASGEWIAFLDSDDAWLPTKLERQLASATEQGLLASCTDAIVEDSNGQVIGAKRARGSGPITLDRLCRGNAVVCSSVIVHRSILTRTGGFPEDASLRLGQDYGLWLRVAAFTSFARVCEPLVVFREHADNSTKLYPADRAAFAAAIAASRWAGAGELGPSYSWAMRRAMLWGLVAQARSRFGRR